MSDTDNNKECYECDGSGSFSCEYCNGWGCILCNGEGEFECETCKGSGTLKANTHICLNCKTKQPEPTNPLGWCLHCYSTEVKPIQVQKKSGWVIMDILKSDTIRLGSHHNKRLIEMGGAIEYFYCDDLNTAYKLLDNTLREVCIEGFFGTYVITQEQMEYIKTISKFENGKFHFSGDDSVVFSENGTSSLMELLNLMGYEVEYDHFRE